MKNTVHLPSVRRIILHALMIARERIQEPIAAARVVPRVQTDRKSVVHSIKAQRDKAFGSARSEVQTGFSELVASIIEMEVSLCEAIGDLSYAQGEKAEKLKQRVIQLQLQLAKLRAQKAQLPIEDEEQALRGAGQKFNN